MAPPRSLERVPRLSRTGCAHQSRLNFIHVLLRRFQKENWRFQSRCSEIGQDPGGYAVYSRLPGGERA